MIGLACARWTVLRLLRTPWVWLACVAAAGLWGLAATLGPVGIHSDPFLVGRAHLQLAHLGMLAGASLAVHLLAGVEWIFARAPFPQRTWAQVSALGAGTALGWLAAAGLPLLTGSPLEPAHFVGASALAGLHLCALGLVILQAPAGPAARAGLLIGASTLLPALLEGSGAVGSALAGLLDPFRLLEASVHGPGPQLGASLASILACLVAALLLGAPSHTNRQEPRHALRHPR